ncbi:MAG: DUF5689 domain-containing protein [Candidatus Cryptobacteroides sp.]
MKLNMKRMAQAAAMLLLLMAGGCRQEDITEMDLAVNDKVLNLKASEGSTHVLVWCNGSWTASFTEETGWATIEKSSGSGDGEFILNYQANAELMRRAVIRIEASGVAEPLDITINQAGEITSPSVKFLANEREYISWETSDFVEFETNLPDSEKGALKVEANQDWVTSATIEGSKVSFSLAENVSGESRKASLSLTYEDIDENVYRTTFDIVQTATGGSLTFTPEEMTVDSFAADKTAPCISNLGTFAGDVTSSVAYEGTDRDWISNVALDGNVVRFKVAANEKRVSRKAVITMKLESKGIEAKLAVTQVEYQKELTFDELRATLSAAGQKTFDGDYFVAVVTSDATDDNVQTNPMIEYGKIDTDVAKSTFYVSPEDMHCGIRIRTATPDDNAVTKGQKVKISLAGATLTREDNPVRYTLSGITANSYSVDGTVNLTPNTRTVAEISDNDVYTLVRLQTVEIAVNLGSYANISSAWMDSAQRQNVATRMLRDEKGGCINMLVNTDTPWHYIGKIVPRGCGSVTGIIVADTKDEVPFYRNMGKYQIRPRSLSDISIAESEAEGFTNTIAEWYYPQGNTTQYKIADDGSVGKLLASTGEGYVQTSSDIQPKVFNAFLQTSATSDIDGGYRGFRFLTSKTGPAWWDADESARQSISIGFSAKDISAGSHPVLIFTAATGEMKSDNTGQVPLNWNVYCKAGSGANELIDKIEIRPLPGTSIYKLLNLALGLGEYCIDLPDSIAGQENVTVTLVAASSEAIDWNTGEFTATAATGVAQRFLIGTIAIKYNK